MRVGIIGSGIGGLALAALLAQDGHEVEIFEKNEQTGGRAGIMEVAGFKFDTGPSWYLMPEVFEHFYGMFDKKSSDFYKLKKLTPAYKVFFDYRETITVSGDLAQDAQTFENLEAGAGKQLVRYVQNAEEIYKLAMSYFLYENATITTYLKKRQVLRNAPSLLPLLSGSIHSFIKKRFSNQAIQQILEYPMVFLGASPFNAPALYHLMSYIDFKQGVYYPNTGIRGVIDGIESLGKELGVKIHLNTDVSKIVTNEQGRATHILAGGAKEQFDLIVSNADLHHTEMSLLEKSARTFPEKYWQKATQGPSALLLYLGVEGTIANLEHHNLLFVEDWAKNFSDIFEHKTWPDKPSIYISNPSKSDSTVAPKNHENIFVLIPLPAGGDTPDIDAYVERILTYIEQECGIENFKKRIKVQKRFTPDDFMNKFNSWQGSALGLAHTLRQSAFFRPSVKSKKISNLYYVGANVQPGIGLPMCLISAEVALRQIQKDLVSK